MVLVLAVSIAEVLESAVPAAKLCSLWPRIGLVVLVYSANTVAPLLDNEHSSSSYNWLVQLWRVWPARLSDDSGVILG